MAFEKDTKQAKVRVGYDGRVHKWYRGPLCKQRFENELRVLKYLERQGCDFVPKVLEADAEDLYLVTTNCGKIVDQISESKLKQVYSELEQYGVEHGDAFARNVTYNGMQGRFNVIDFEFSTILATGEGLTVAEAEAENQRLRKEQGENL